MKIIKIEASSHYDLGFKYGSETSDEIKEIIDLVKRYSKDKLGFASKFIPLILDLSFLFKNRLGKRVLETIKGIADGSGVERRWIYLLNFTYDFASLSNEFFKFLGCSSFAIPQRDGKHIIIGKTTDIIQVDYFTKALIKLRIDLSYKVACSNFVQTISFPGQVTSDFVIINKSIFVGLNDGGLNTRKNQLLNSSIIPVIYELTEEKKNMEQIIDALQKMRTIHPYAVIVSDGTVANTVTMDLMPTGVRLEKMADKLIRTNFLLHRSDRDELYGKDWTENKYYLSALRRFTVLSNASKSEVGLEDAKKMLCLHEENSDYFKGSVNNRATSNAVIWDGKTKKLYVPEKDNFPLMNSNLWMEHS